MDENPAASAGAQFRSLVWEDSTCLRATNSEPQPPGPRAATARARAQPREEPARQKAACPQRLQKAHEQQRRPSTTKINTRFLKKQVD